MDYQRTTECDMEKANKKIYGGRRKKYTETGTQRESTHDYLIFSISILTGVHVQVFEICSVDFLLKSLRN